MKKSIFFRRPVTFLCIFISLFIVSLVAVKHIPISFFPDTKASKLYIKTHWRGASAERVEERITSRIESACYQIREITSVESFSYPNRSKVVASLQEEATPENVKIKLNEKLQQIKHLLPSGISSPNISQHKTIADLKYKIFTLQVYGNSPPHKLAKIAENISDDIERVKEVKKVNVWGKPRKVLQIFLDRKKMQFYRITPSQIRSNLKDLESKVVLGTINEGGSELPISLKGKTEISRVKNCRLNQPDKPEVRLKEIANFKIDNNRKSSISLINGKPVLSLEVQKKQKVNLLSVAKKVKKKVSRLEKSLSNQGIHLLIKQNLAKEVREKVTDLYKQLLLCFAIMIFILFGFVRNFRVVFIVITTVCYTVLVTLLAFFIFKIEINLITLSALILSLGILIDNSIVVSENIIRNYGAENSATRSINDALKSLVFPVLVSSLTTIIVFLPILFLDTTVQDIFVPFALGIIISTLISFVISFSLTPFLIGRVLASNLKIKDISQYFKGPLDRVLNFNLRHKISIVVGFIILLLAAIVTFVWVLPKESTQLSREDKVVVKFSFNKNRELKDTRKVVKQLQKVIESYDQQIKYYSINADEKRGRAQIIFPDKLLNTAIPSRMKGKLTNWASQKHEMNIMVKGLRDSYQKGGYGYKDYILKLKGYNYQYLKNLSDQIARKLRQNRRVQNLTHNNTAKSFRYKENSAYMLNFLQDFEKMSFNRLDRLLYKLYPFLNPTFFSGSFNLKGENEPLRYIIQYQDSDSFNLYKLRDFIVPGKFQRPIRELSDLTLQEQSAYIYKNNQQYQRFICYDYYGQSNFGEKYLDKVLASIILPPGFEISREEAYHSVTQQTKNKKWLYTFGLILLLIYIIMAALYESYAVPFLIFLVIPFSFIGVIAIYFFSGSGITLFSYLGFVYLFGIVVNNSVILLDRINRKYENSRELKSAVHKGVQERFVPILMTTATSVFSFIPLVILNTNSTWYSFGLTIIGGVGFSFIVIMSLNPILYCTLIKFKRKLGIERREAIYNENS